MPPVGKVGNTRRHLLAEWDPQDATGRQCGEYKTPSARRIVNTRRHLRAVSEHKTPPVSGVGNRRLHRSAGWGTQDTTSRLGGEHKTPPAGKVGNTRRHLSAMLETLANQARRHCTPLAWQGRGTRYHLLAGLGTQDATCRQHNERVTPPDRKVGNAGGPLPKPLRNTRRLPAVLGNTPRHQPAVLETHHATCRQ